MSKNYIKNLETGKIELHFEKSEYLALPAEQKKELKRFFLWSKTADAWVSRSIKDHYWAIKIANNLGFTEEERIGERLSYEEQLERKAEKAEHRAERYDQYANNAINRGKNMQKEMEKYRGDIAFLTQPIIAGHAGSQAFGRRREKIFNRYFKGFEEYRKSEYFKEKAETARNTASQSQLKDPVYLSNRIKESTARIKKLEKNIIHYEEILTKKINNDPSIHSFYQDKTQEQIETWLNDTLDKIEWEIDKLAFLENCMDEVGGNKYNKDNVKIGYIIKIQRWGKCEVVSTGTKNITFKILEGGAKGGILTDPYAAIIEILEEVKEQEKIENPFKIDDILCSYNVSGDRIIKAYQVIKTTKTGVKLQQIKIEDNKPIANTFVSDKAIQRKVVKSKWSDFVGVYEGDWQLHKYTA